ncbi:hypothetical protein OPKNFCMD_2424 [Methylobacterium crusticola]|uniref:Uncharacterized protein n=1 Tax=Methylobacterium crusticola TaxID=1697972 RepID=A0ABQ4QXA8_9HYPH|nr:hypothetical protein [Methylobacterium crusticola]GJD49691.1 hypothetical protein OPKNFCMD_2424 [Methylobacterium crusticola]
MGVGIASERRLLSEDELQQVRLSHYPDLGGLDGEATLSLARWLREQRDRIRDIVAARRRARRGKAATGGIEAPGSSERGLAAKKQVFARALRRVNARLDRARAAKRREAARANLGDALRRKGAGRRHHPAPGRTPRHGMHPADSARRVAGIEPGQVGRVSQSVKDAQARRDG